MSTPRLSVLLPVRDAALTLPQALASLRRQTFPDFEIIAVDDGSRDESREILFQAARKDSRLKLVSTPGIGLVTALGLARQQAQAKLLARMDADDLAHPERLRLQLEHLDAHPELSGTGSLVCLFPRNSLKIGWLRYESWINSLITWEQIRRERFVESPLVHPSVVLRAEALDAVGGYRECPWPEDSDLWLRLIEAGYLLDKLPRTLLFWRNQAGRESFRHPRYHPERHREMKLAFLLSGPLKGRSEVVVWGAGKNGRRFARLLLAGGVGVRALIDIDPKKIGRTCLGRPIVSPALLAERSLPFILGAVASPGARELIRAELLKSGREEELDFIFVQ